MLRSLPALVVAIVVLVACGSTTTTTRRSAPTTRPHAATAPTTTRPPVYVVATAKVPSVGVWDAPGQGQPARTLQNPQPPYDTPLVFLVQEQQPDWIHVYLPVRPNGSTGWVQRSDVTLATHDFRIVVELSAHRITVWQGSGIFLQVPVGVGTTDTPTPGGLYYTKELLVPIDSQGRPIPGGPYGPYAYGLSGYSDVLYNFAGGDGVIGIHGTNDPSSLGRNASHGCIRMSNDAITKLAKALPIGVPVEIRA